MNARRLNGILATAAVVALAAVIGGCSASKQTAPDIIGGPPPVGSTPPNLLFVSPSETCGNAGNVITVVGQDLAPGGVFPGVTINNVPATVLNVSSGFSGALAVDIITIRTPSLGGLIPPGGLQVPIRVTTANGTDTITTLRVLPACQGPPVLAQVDPTSASRVGGTPIILRGAGLGCVTQVQLIGRSGGGTFNVAVVDVTSDQEITVTSPATASQTTEFFDVRVVSECGSSTFASGFTFTGGVGGPGPVIPNATGITPAQGPATGGNSALITGANLNLATRVRFGSVTLTLNALTNGFFIDANGQIFIPSVPASATGAGTQFAANVFVGTSTTEDLSPVVYTYIGQGAPTCATVAPATGTNAGGTDVLITGAGLDEVDQVLFGGIAASSLTRPSPGTLALRTPAFPFAIPVSVEFLVNGVRILCPTAFTFVEESSDPPFEVTSISPDVGLQTGNEVITITGTGLEDVASIRICNVVIDGTNVLLRTDTFVRALTQPFTGAVPVTCDVVVTTTGGQSDTIIRGFTFQPPTPNGQTFTRGTGPVLGQGVFTAPAAGGGNFRIQGVNLIGVNDVHFGGTQANDALACLIDVQSNTELTGVVPAYFTPGGPFPASVGVFPESSSGIDPTTVLRPDGQLFRYYPNPTLSTATGASGDVVQAGTVVTVTGSGFRPEEDVFIGRVTVSNSGLVEGTSRGQDEVDVQFTVLSNTTLQFGFPSVSVADYYDITIHLVGEGLPCVGDYEFTLLRTVFFGRDPNAAVLEPNVGRWTGGTTVVIAGDFTLPIASVTIGGIPQTILDQDSDSVTIRTSALFDEDDAGVAENVVLTDLEGQTELILGGYTFIPNPDLVAASTDAPNCPGLATPVDSPLPVEQGQLVTITGADMLGITLVRVGTASANIVTQSDTSLTFSVPAAPSGGPRFDITTEAAFPRSPAGTTDASFVDTLGGAVQYQADPTITAIAPATGPAGQPVTITGTNLANVNGDATLVFFDGLPAAVISTSATSLVVLAPAGTPGDTAVITVSTCMGSAGAATPFLFPCNPPNVTGIAPTSGAATGGTSVTLTGTDLAGPGGSAPTVTFGTATAIVTDTQPNQVTVDAPPGTLGSRVTVTLTTCGGSDSAPTQFSYGCEQPTIVDISPDFGQPGTVLTITGINLNSPDGTGVTVTFGTLPPAIVTPSAATATSLTVTVPDEALSVDLTVDVTVTNCGGTDSVANAFEYCVAPTANAPNPVQGSAGDTVTITGNRFVNPDGSFATVTFGGVAGTVQNVTGVPPNQTLTVTAPAGLAGSQTVRVTNCGGTVVSGQFLFCTDATITSISPIAGAPGTQVIINGTNLIGANNVVGTVTIGGQPAPLVGGAGSQTATRLIVTVGALATGNVPVTVTTCAGTLVGPFFRVCDAPSVDGIVPDNGPAGTVVTISGTNLLSDDGTQPVVRFGTTTVPAGDILSVSDTAIQVEAPSGFPTTTSVPVTVTTCGGADASPVDFLYSGTTTCSAATITSLAPTTGTSTGGTQVTISGTGLIGNDGVTGDVFFGATQVLVGNVISASPTQLVVLAPAGAGVVAVRVETCAGTFSSNTRPFTYCTRPAITSLVPPTGTAGTSVRINGTSLLSADGTATVVRFGSVDADILDPGDGTYIIAEAPVGVPAGTIVQVSATTCGGQSLFTAAANFTYNCAAPTIATLVPSAGATAGGNQVTITGTGLVGSNGVTGTVTFGGATVPVGDVLSASPTQLIVLAPAGGGIVSVRVTTCGGPSNTRSYRYCVQPAITSISPTSGDSTTPVRINGTTLLSADGTTAIVRFGAEEADILDPGDGTYIVAEAPAGFLAGTVVQVSVTTCGGQTPFIAAANFTYVATVQCNPSTPPSITSVENATTTVVAPPYPLPGLPNDVVIITGTNLIGADGELPVIAFGEATSTGGTPKVSILDVTSTRVTVLVPSETDLDVLFPLGAIVRISITTCGGTDFTDGVDQTDFVFQP